METTKVPLDKLQCKTCRYFGKYHEKGSIIIESGVMPIDEPYIICTQYRYAVLASRANECTKHKTKM